MSKIDRLVKNYGNFISIPWRNDTPAAQRVIFCIYDSIDELKLRARIDEFTLATRSNGHDWHQIDLTDMFAEWLSKQKYVQGYFKRPELLPSLIPSFQTYMKDTVQSYINKQNISHNAVLAVFGVSSLFGILKVKDFVDDIAPLVQGRLVILFPGSYENNNYRLLDGYDGWNYHAVPITADKDY